MSDESDKRKQYRLEILKIALANSYKPKLTSIEDVTTALKIEHSIATTELTHLSDNGYLDFSNRDGTPMWQIKGKARDVMEKKPKTYDEFVSLIEEPQTDFGTPESIPSPDSTSFEIPITRKAGSILAAIGITGIIAIVFFAASMPNLEVDMYNSDNTIATYDNTWTTNSRLKIHQVDNQLNSWSNMCFRISNTANYIESVPIGANNFKSSITTDSNCKECNSRSSHDFLKAQEHVDDCEKIQVKNNVKNFNFFIVLEYDTFLSFVNEFKYSCQFTGTTEENSFKDVRSLFECNLDYKKWSFAG